MDEVASAFAEEGRSGCLLPPTGHKKNWAQADGRDDPQGETFLGQSDANFVPFP